MAITRKAGRKLVAEVLEGALRELDVTTNGSTTTVVSTQALDFAEEDDAFPRWHLPMTTLAGVINTFEDRTIKRQGGFTASTGTFTVGRAYSGTPVTTTPDVAELHRYSPTNMHTAIGRAISWLYNKGIHRAVRDTSIVVGNILHNGSFEDWASSSSVAGWTDSGGTQLQEADFVIDGKFAMHFTGSGGDTLTQNLYDAVTVNSTTDLNLSAGLTTTQTNVPVDDGTVFNVGDKILIESERMRVLGVEGNTLYVTRALDGTSAATHADNTDVSFVRPALQVQELVDKTIHFEGFVWASAADAGRLRATGDGSTYVSSDFHKGKDEWEYLEVDFKVPADATEITFVVDVAGSNVIRADGLIAYGPDHVNRYAFPSSFPYPREIRQAHDRKVANPNYRLLTHQNPPIAGHRLQILGRGELTKPTSETSLIEVSGAQAEVLATKAAAFVMEMHGSGLRDLERKEALAQAAQFHADVERLLAKGGIRSANIPITDSDGVWRFDPDGEIPSLVLNPF